MAEFEELRLTVDLVDNASAGLANIRTPFAGINQAAAQAQGALGQVAQTAGQAAQQATPHVRTLDQQFKGLTKSAEEFGRGLTQMALSFRSDGFAGFAQLALGAREAMTGLQGVNEGLTTLAPTAAATAVSLGAVALGVTAVAGAVVAYGVAVFKFSQEMYQLSQTSKSLG